MKSFDREIQEMRSEDRRYGEQNNQKKKKIAVHAKPKNPKNLARYNMDDLVDMEDEGYDSL